MGGTCRRRAGQRVAQERLRGFGWVSGEDLYHGGSRVARDKDGREHEWGSFVNHIVNGTFEPYGAHGRAITSVSCRARLTVSQISPASSVYLTLRSCK